MSRIFVADPNAQQPGGGPGTPGGGVISPPQPPIVFPVFPRRIPAILRWEFSNDDKIFPVDYKFASDGTGAVILMGTEGLTDPPVEIPDLTVPTWDGSAVTEPIFGPREIFFRMFVNDKTYADSQARIQLLRNITNNRRYGMTRLACISSNGTNKWIEGQRIVSRNDGDWTPQYHDKDWRSLAVVLRCPDPWWKGTALNFAWTNTVGTQWFPILPVKLSAETIIGKDLNVFMPGDAPAYPSWLIEGPLTEVSAIRSDGAQWRLSITLDAGQTVSVDTDPRNLRVIGPTGTSRWANIVPPYYDMWPLLPGDNSVRVNITGSTGVSKVSMSVRPKYASAL